MAVLASRHMTPEVQCKLTKILMGGLKICKCPKCKSEMRIVAFVTDERDISKIATSLRIPNATAPPPIPRAPQQELFDEIPQDDFI